MGACPRWRDSAGLPRDHGSDGPTRPPSRLGISGNAPTSLERWLYLATSIYGNADISSRSEISDVKDVKPKGIAVVQSHNAKRRRTIPC